MKRFLNIRYLLGGVIVVIVIALGFEFQDSYRKHGPFRTMQDPIASVDHVDLTGLRELQFAGGPLTPLTALTKRLHALKGRTIIADGINGKYGYIYGVPDTYLAYNKHSPSWKSYVWRLWYTGTINADPSLIVAAEKAVPSYGFDYRRFRIGSKYRSRDADIDEFVSFIDTLPKNVWVYFHCIHGKGRTSMMLVMADIIKNAPQVTLANIVKRQHLLGSVDLFDTVSWTLSTYNTQMLEERKKFIENFYEFIAQRKSGGVQQWSDWARHKRIG